MSSFDNDRILRYGTDGYFVDTFADRTNSPLAVPWQIAFVAEAPADDTDADGVIDPLDECNNTPHGIPVNERGRPIGDLDADCDADLMDFAIFQACVTGPLS